MKANIVFAVLCSIFIGGCYTIYTHPNVVHKDENKRVDIIEVSYKNDCQSCHSEEELGKYNYYVKKEVFMDVDSLDESTELKYDDIAYFYNMPWWFEITLSNEYTPAQLEMGTAPVINSAGTGYYPTPREPYDPPIFLPGPTVPGPTGGNTPVTKERTNTNDKNEPVTRPTNTNNNTRETDGTKNTTSGRR